MVFNCKWKLNSIKEKENILVNIFYTSVAFMLLFQTSKCYFLVFHPIKSITLFPSRNLENLKNNYPAKKNTSFQMVPYPDAEVFIDRYSCRKDIFPSAETE